MSWSRASMFVTGVFARRIMGRACATAMDTGGLPLRALEQAVSWGRLAWRRKPFRDLRDLELATFRWISWRGLEASAPALGPQDTGTDRNRVSCKPSGASRPAIRAEQKSGHIIPSESHHDCWIEKTSSMIKCTVRPGTANSVSFRNAYQRSLSF